AALSAASSLRVAPPSIFPEMTNYRPKPPAEWLRHLYGSGQWDRLVKVARESLATEPDDEAAHRYLAWGYAKMGRTKMMAPHVKYLLQADADTRTTTIWLLFTTWRRPSCLRRKSTSTTCCATTPTMRPS